MSCEEPSKSTPVKAPANKSSARSSTPVKVSVNELDTQNTVFTKASKNLRSVMQTLDSAKKSIGSDRMFDSTRRQLAKLSELLEIRAFVLDALAEAMTAATGSYKTAQTQGVKVATDFRAHKTDFYGKPVHVSAATGAAGGRVETVGASVAVEAAGASSAAGSTAGQTVNVTQNITNIVNNYGGAASSANDAAIETAATAPAAVTPTVEAPSGAVSVGAAAAGMAGAAVLGGAAYRFSELAKEKREVKKREKAEKQVDDQLAAAKQKLRDIEEEETRIKAKLSEEADAADDTV